MNTDFLRYKSRCLSFILLLSYAYIHTHLTGVYEDTDLNQMLNFSIRLPFAQRLLTPIIAYVFQRILPLSASDIFFLLEWAFISLFYIVSIRLLSVEFEHKQAQLLSWLFILLLPLISVVNYRYTIAEPASFFYPYDTSSLFFMALGFLLCLRAQWFYFMPVLFLATINRESSVLLVLLIPALHWQKIKTVIRPFLLALLSYITARWCVLHSLKGTPGTLTEWYFRQSSHTYFEVNLFWLLNDTNLLLLLFCFAGLPLFWFAFYDYIPTRYRPVRYVTLFYFVGLLLVGNFMEARIFTEIAVLLYLPVCVALHRWLQALPPEIPLQTGLLYYINRYSVLAVLGMLILCRNPLDEGVIWLSHLLSPTHS